MGNTQEVVNSHATALQNLAKAASTDIQQTREVLADVSARVDTLRAAQHAFASRGFWSRLRWLVTGV